MCHECGPVVHCALCTGSNHQQGQWQPKKVEAFQDRVVAVSAGRDHSLALTADGGVWSWGRGGRGQLGHGDYAAQWQPKKIEAFAGQRVVATSAGGDLNLALTADGAVFTWGKGEYGRLGHGEDESNQLLPKMVEVWAQGQESA